MIKPLTLRPLAVALLCLSLAACAGSLHFREASSLLEKGQHEAALKQYREALAAEPNNAEYRITYLRTRDALVSLRLEQAEAALRAGRAGETAALYKQILAISDNEARALDGLRRLDRDSRHAQYIAEAEGELKRGGLDAAQSRLRLVLTENPDNEAARALQRNIEGWRGTPKLSGEARLAAALHKPVSIEFRDAQLREIFEVLSRSSGLNFVLDRDVRGDQRTTIFLRNATVADALSLTLATNQLERRVLDEHSVLIYPNTPAKAHSYQALSVKTFTFNNADAKTVANTIRTILKSRDVVVLERQNALILRDTPEAIRMAERIVALHDTPEPEVMLEVEVLEVQRTRLLNLGVQYPAQVSLAPLASSSTSSSAGTLTLHDLLHLNTGQVKASLDPVTVSATHNVGDVRILANPRIRVINREKAQVMVGQRVPTVTTTTTSTGFAANSVQYLDVGLKLNVEPTITPDGDVSIRMSLEVSSVTSTSKLSDGTTTYELGTRSASTLLRLHDGENQVLAGLINDQQTGTSNRIPGLGDLPVLGRLFGSQSDNSTQSEIVLSITPRIVRPALRPSAELQEFESGTEASLRSLTTATEGAPSDVYPPPPPPTPQAQLDQMSAQPPTATEKPGNGTH
ncbi:secretin N-terminal domain-containing protein [Niveibacterium terrae]|uniref:secretin N-terminal domain-containing protein n=1 Tax=Niveibacterium terrae TaxID=3373598 RepID=UPI003A92AF9C